MHNEEYKQYYIKLIEKLIEEDKVKYTLCKSSLEDILMLLKQSNR